jgi:hypothetical protein
VIRQIASDELGDNAPAFRAEAVAALSETLRITTLEAIARAHDHATAARGEDASLEPEDIEAVAVQLLMDFS